ncbi:pentapeptide repeat protein [Calothrix sp. NIES-4071]|nr:pentapeptide repeat protein [Calothrix sp. NIES-4071]BAZ59941.1 pentapeptide repeat protein [Calothrix sp. NIES-4105]
MSKSNQPGDFDAVLGGLAPPPVDGIVLGGISGAKARATSPDIKVRISALSEALNYEDAGLDLVIQALHSESKQLQRAAYWLLRERDDEKVKQALQNYKPWNLEERLRRYPGYRGDNTSIFANRQVVDFDPEVGIIDPVNTAYALRCEYDEEESAVDKLAVLLQHPKAVELEALVIGAWSGELTDYSSSTIIEALVATSYKLTNLKALFIGDIHYQESEISWILQSDISPILQAYPNLEILQVRGGTGLVFSPVVHNNLEALIIETGGLNPDTIAQICACDFPNLTHLELWLGSADYGGHSSIDDLRPILIKTVFPNLVYLGLRNSTYSNNIAEAVINSPLIDSIKILDLSMGTLTDAGANVLLKSPVVKQLDILNISENYLSDDKVALLSLQESRGNFNVHVMTNEQKKDDYDDEEAYRYCSVAE